MLPLPITAILMPASNQCDAGLIPDRHWLATGKRGWHDWPVTPQEHVDPPEGRPPQQVRIVHLTAPAFRALANGDLTAANTASPVPLSAYFAGPEWRAVWQMRSEQVEEDPASAAWVTGVIWDERHQAAVGRAGYHGPPDPSGMVEIGYAVDPAYRRRGYARAALEALLQRAAREPLVRTVRVTISPDNVASYGLASQYGFTEVGEQWDDEDGLEIIYELDAKRR
jgi:RimJ/RimL family protein N-acetyltransferase